MSPSIRAEVLRCLLTGEAWTLHALRRAVGRGCETTISAKIRDLRQMKDHRCSDGRLYDVRSWHIGDGVWLYRLVSPERA